MGRSFLPGTKREPRLRESQHKYNQRTAGGSIMPRRQFANMSVAQLEKLFDEKRDKPETLKSILAELTHRSVPRAQDLRRRVTQALSVGKYDAKIAKVLKPVSPEDCRFAAEYFLKGQNNWTFEERSEAAILARPLVNLASLTERRLRNPEG
jgi:hypothetical protein